MFNENAFSWEKWNVPVLQSPDETKEYINNLGLIGKKIKSIKAIGLCYNLVENNIEDAVYSLTNDEKSSDFENISEDTELYRWVEVDEPIIIEFDDNDTLEIDFSEASSLKMSKNGLPKDITWGINRNNADLNIVFSNCIGAKIQDIVVLTTTEDILENFTGSHGIELPDFDEYVTDIVMVLDNNQTLNFYAWFDYGHLRSKEYEIDLTNGKDVMIKFKDLKKTLNNI